MFSLPQRLLLHEGHPSYISLHHNRMQEDKVQQLPLLR